jgi:2-alkyl-3-oxoalkanoate reductase
MKVFVAGATGAVGKRLVAQLLAGGYQVVAMTRSVDKARNLRALGADAVVADALDRDAVMQVVTRAAPEIVMHQLSGLTGLKSFKRFDKEFALTNRLRTEGTDHLLAAARAAGTRRFIAQSYGNWNYERTGSRVKTEADRLDPNPPANRRGRWRRSATWNAP